MLGCQGPDPDRRVAAPALAPWLVGHPGTLPAPGHESGEGKGEGAGGGLASSSLPSVPPEPELGATMVVTLGYWDIRGVSWGGGMTIPRRGGGGGGGGGG